jgi:hypothetical protein
LLERRIVFFIDDDGRQVGQGRQHSQPSAQHDAGAPLGGGHPVRRPLGIGHVAVQHRQWLAWKALTNPTGKFGRQGDFRHQDQRLCGGSGRQNVG